MKHQMQPCRYLSVAEDYLTCSHPCVRLSSLDEECSACKSCHFFSHRPDALPVPSPVGELKDTWTWAVGITTAPRRQATLADTLASIRSAGWDDVRLFAEPNSLADFGHEDCPVSVRDRTMGAFPNWLLGLSELYLRYPRADAYAMFQDDVQVAANTRTYLESALWPFAGDGIVSLYCPSHYGLHQQPGFHVEQHGWDTWGALAYVFTPGAILSFLSNIIVLGHRRFGRAGGLKNIDSVVGDWCLRTQAPYVVHVPSLAQHTGEHSTLYPLSKASGRRRALRPLRVAPNTDTPGPEMH